MATHSLQRSASPAKPPRVPSAPNSLARRAFLGGIAAIPAIGIAAPALAAPSSNEWQAIVCAYRQEKAEWIALDTAHDELRSEYLRSRPAKPVQPGAPSFHNDMTLNEILAFLRPQAGLNMKRGWRTGRASAPSCRNRLPGRQRPLQMLRLNGMSIASTH